MNQFDKPNLSNNNGNNREYCHIVANERFLPAMFTRELTKRVSPSFQKKISNQFFFNPGDKTFPLTFDRMGCMLTSQPDLELVKNRNQIVENRLAIIKIRNENGQLVNW